MPTRPLTCHQCQPKLLAYVHHQLSDRASRRVARHLNDCPLCYAAWLEQRDLARDLAQSLPALGRPDAPQLGRVWLAIQADMARPRAVSRPPLARFGVACLVFVLALVLPWSLDKQQVALAVPSQPPAPALTATLSVTRAPETALRGQTPTASKTEAVIPAAETPLVPSGTPDTR